MQKCIKTAYKLGKRLMSVKIVFIPEQTGINIFDKS